MEHTGGETIVLRNPPPFSAGSPTEGEIVGATVAFLNGATIVIEHVPDQFKELGLPQPSLAPAQTWRAGDSLKTWDEIVLLVGGGLPEKKFGFNLDEAALQSQQRLAYRKFLAKLLHDPAAITAKFEYMGGLFSKLPKLPVDDYLHATPDGVSVVRHYRLDNWIDATRVGITLLLDHEKKFRQTLCQCQLAMCGKFFLEKKGPVGRPARSYCSPEHMKEAHDMSAAIRMKDKRKH